MTKIYTAHGIGDLVETVRERGRTSFKVKGPGFEVWVDAKEARVAAEDGSPHDLFSYQFTPDKFLNPMAGMYGAETPEKDFIAGRNVFAMPQEATKGFNPMEPAREVRDIKRPYPYDPTPQWPVDMFHDQTIQPGEQEIDPAKRLKPSDPSTQPPSPGPNPKLFATGAYSVLQERPEIVAGPRYPYPGDGLDHYGFGGPHRYSPPEKKPTRGFPESSPLDQDDREYPRQRKDPAAEMPGLRSEDEPVYPFDKVSPNGITVKEMGEGDEPDWYSCPDCGAWHNPFRHMKDRRQVQHPGDNLYQPAYKGRGASLRCADCREADGRHRAPPNEDPFIDTLDRGALPQLVNDPGDDEHVYMKRTPFPKSRGDHFKPTLLHPRAASVFDLDFPTDMPEKFAYIPGVEDYQDHTQIALAAIERQAAIMEGEYGLDYRVGQEMDLVQADPAIREGAWRDVQRKAKRLRSEGRVNIKEANPEAVYASVDGDNGTYDVIIVRGNVFDLGGQSVTSWHCGCPWGQWAFKRRLTYVGRFCSHAYATYQEMRALHDTPGKGTRQREAGVVEDFKSWAKENNQPSDIDGITSFLSRSTGEDDPTDYTPDEVASLYDYAEGHPREAPQRNFDVPYTLDNEEAYKKTGREMLRTTPRSLTPDIQFVPEGEDEHLVDLTKDERKTTGPGQIMHGADAREKKEPRVTGNEGWQFGLQKGPFAENPDLTEDDIVGRDLYEDDPEIEHFGGVLPPFLAEADSQAVNNPTPGSPSNPRPDAGESTRDLNKLRDLIQEPLSDSFGHMDDRNDEVRDLVDDLHDGGVAADNLVASRQFDASGSFFGEGGGDWLDGGFAGSGRAPKDWYGTSADYIDENERPNFQDVTDLPDGDILKYNDSDSPVKSPKEAYRYSDNFSNETSSTGPMGISNGPADMGDVNNGAPLMNAGDDMTGTDETGTLAFLKRLAEGEEDSAGGDIGFGGDDLGGGGLGLGAGGGSDLSSPSPIGGSGSTHGPSGVSGIPGAGDFTDMLGGGSGGSHGDSLSGGGGAYPVMPGPSSGGIPVLPGGGAGAGDFAPMSGGAPGDMASVGDKNTSYANRRSIKDSIRERNARGRRYAYDPSTLPPGWGSVPDDPESDESPIPDIPGQKEVEKALPQLPGMPGGKGKGGPGGGAAAEGGEAGEMGELAELAPLVASRRHGGYGQPSDDSDIVRQFQATAGAQSLTRGGGGSQRGASMGQYTGTRAERGRFSDGDIAGAADSFLTRTAGRNYSPAEQADLMNEFHPLGARNLDGLDLQGTHYTQ